METHESMEISEFTLKLIIVIVPGAIASIIYEKLTIHKKWTPFQFTLNSILMGGISYMFADFFCEIIFDDSSFDSFWDNLPLKEIPFLAVVKASFASIFIGFTGAWMDKVKLINKVARRLRLSNKYGDENLYSYFLGNNEIKEVYVRDMHTNHTYHGMIQSYSETDNIKEMVLTEVKVYNYESSEYLYDSQYIYLSRPKDFLTLEIYPYQTPTDGN